MRQNFIDFCKEYATEHLDDMVGNTYYVCDLCLDITQAVNDIPAY